MAQHLILNKLRNRLTANDGRLFLSRFATVKRADN